MMTTIFYRLWAMSLQASLLILIVLVMRFLLRKYPRSYSYCLWMLVGVRLLCPLWVESPFSLQPDLSGYSMAFQKEQEEGIQLPEAGGAQLMLPAEGTETGLYPLEEQETIFPVSSEGAEKSEREAQENGESHSFSLKRWWERIRESMKESLDEVGLFNRVLLVLYPLGMTGLMAFYLGQYFKMRRRVSTAVWEKGNVWISDRIQSPFVMGVIFPKIYLPCQLNGVEKKHVLRHERTHIRHQDPLIRIIGIVCICLHWWNPLVWLAVHRMSQDMEMFCDETVLRKASLEERKAYARTLLSFAERGNGLGTGLAFVESHTEKRVKNIMKKRKRSLFIVVLVVVLAIFCVIALMTVPGGKLGEVSSGNVDGVGQGGALEAENDSLEESDGREGSNDGKGDALNGSSANGQITDEELNYFMQASLTVPDFSKEEDLDKSFWEEYLFVTYTSDFEREQVVRYSKLYEEDTPYIRVSLEEVDGAIRKLFGKGLSEYGISPETLGTDGGNLVYEEGFFYISTSDSPIFSLSQEKVTQTDSLTELSFLKTAEDGELVSQVVLHLLPDENGQGFRLSGKEEALVPIIPEGRILEGQSFEVEMNPYGKVTFAVYAPDLEQSPYADVTFRLLQDGEELYSFPLRGTGILQEGTTFDGMAAVAFPDLNGDGYTDVVTIANYMHTSGPIPSLARIFTYNQGGYFLEEEYLAEAYNRSHEEKTIEDIEAFASQRENQDYFVKTSIYGRWQVTGYKLPGISALTQEELDSLTGARLEYGNAFLWTNVDGETREVEGYEKSTVTMAELEEEFRMNGAKLGITAEELVSYRVEAQGDSLFGQFFYLVDAEHALIYYEGVFFEAVRE